MTDGMLALAHANFNLQWDQWTYIERSPCCLMHFEQKENKNVWHEKKTQIVEYKFKKYLTLDCGYIFHKMWFSLYIFIGFR